MSEELKPPMRCSFGQSALIPDCSWRVPFQRLRAAALPMTGSVPKTTGDTQKEVVEYMAAAVPLATGPHFNMGLG